LAKRTRLDAVDLAAAWDAHAADWIAWAREPGLDSYWRFNRDVFLELVPAPGRRTLDLGCGEGRLSRDLKALGHDVVGVDRSEAMLAAARDADPSIETHLADAASLPFDDASFDCVLAFMSLQDVEDAHGAIAEATRVLEAGGRFCFAIVHPLNSAGQFHGDDAGSPFVIDGSYLAESYFQDEVEHDGRTLTLVSAHRPLQTYTDALADAAFVIERLREPPIPTSAYTAERSRRWTRLPLFLYVRAVKAAPASPATSPPRGSASGA
jgi:SAM-dependent methyltransferase